MISIIIVNYNEKEMLRTCIESIKKNTVNEYEIIIVDNDSNDGSCEMLLEQFPNIKLIRNDNNVGYTKANNQGLRIAEGDYIVLLNNDVEIKENAFDNLKDFLDKNASSGAAASKLIYPDGSLQGSVKALPTPASALFGRRSPLTRWFPKNRFSRKYLVYLDQDFTKNFEVGNASSACLMVKSSVIEKVGPLDEDFVMYWVDADWSRRIHDKGFTIFCVPASVAIHYEHKGGSRSSKKASYRSIINFNMGAYIYYRKHHTKFWWSPKKLIAISGLSINAAGQLILNELKRDKYEAK